MKELIMQARKTLLFNGGIPWEEREGNENFDIPMGCSDGVEICESAQSHILR